jgi:hypothetical protein
MKKTTTQPERRQFGRRQSRLRGIIHLKGNNVRSCVVRNFSEAGALIVLDDESSLPRQFDLTIERTGLRVYCETKRRDGKSLGVIFRAAAGSSTSPTARRQVLLTYEELLALATADREGAEFVDRYGQAILKPAVFEMRGNLRA